jgi:hypothetical protein
VWREPCVLARRTYVYCRMNWFTAVREAFSNTYTNKEVPNKISGHGDCGRRMSNVEHFWHAVRSVTLMKHKPDRRGYLWDDCGQLSILRTPLLYCKSSQIIVLLGVTLATPVYIPDFLLWRISKKKKKTHTHTIEKLTKSGEIETHYKETVASTNTSQCHTENNDKSEK